MDVAIVGCSQLVTLKGPARPRIHTEMHDLGIVDNGAMLLRDGKIVWAGSREDTLQHAQAGVKVVNVDGRVITPGHVDAHTHPVFAGSRLDDFERRIAGMTYAEIGAQGGGIRSTVQATQESSEDDLYLSARQRLDRFVRLGTTTLEAKSGYGGNVQEELKLLRVIQRLQNDKAPHVVPTALGAHAIPQGSTAQEHVQAVIEHLIPTVAKEKLAEYFDVFVEEGYFGIEETREMAAAAKAHDLHLRLHVDQLKDGSGAQLAAELGATTADHLEHVSDAGIHALVKAGVQPVLLPGSVLSIGSHDYAPARKMIDDGLAVVIASDFNPGSSPMMSLPLIMGLACTQMHMLPSEALCACTINAAYSLARGAELGSLEPTKNADFVVWNCSDYREISYWMGANLVDSVYVNGERYV